MRDKSEEAAYRRKERDVGDIIHDLRADSPQ
jgi:hypothetical protein